MKVLYTVVFSVKERIQKDLRRIAPKGIGITFSVFQ